MTDWLEKTQEVKVGQGQLQSLHLSGLKGQRLFSHSHLAVQQGPAGRLAQVPPLLASISGGTWTTRHLSLQQKFIIKPEEQFKKRADMALCLSEPVRTKGLEYAP